LSTEPISSDGLNQAAAESLREELDLALMQVPECQRQAFQLFHEQALTYAEIAEAMNCPLGTVKTWVHRARANIIDQFRDRQVVGNGEALSSEPSCKEVR
jgi:RNA polymerase sigma-70 factor (ECF subfamily)